MQRKEERTMSEELKNNVEEPIVDAPVNDAKDDDVLLRVEHLSQYFGYGPGALKAVNNVSFDIKKGEVFGLVGESGCGKTTTGRTIIKLYNATGGNVYYKGTRIVAGLLEYKQRRAAQRKEFFEAVEALCGKPNGCNEKPDLKDAWAKLIKVEKEEGRNIRLAKHDQKRCDKDFAKKKVKELVAEYKPKFKDENCKGKAKLALCWEFVKKFHRARKERLVTEIQMVFQDPIASLDPRMTVREIIAEGLRIKGVHNKEEINNKVYEVLEKVGLVKEHANRYPHEFSGGQRQRIGVARAIIMRPEMIIADEPISALDVSIQAQVINLLNDLRDELGLTILFIAHDLSVVKYFSDRIAVMYFGNMVELATSDELFAHPLHPYTRSLLSAIPLPDPIYEKQRKRIVYNPLADHDYSVDKPTLREVEPGHFVSCNQAEFEKYQAICRGEAENLPIYAQDNTATAVNPVEQRVETTKDEVEAPVEADMQASLLKTEGTPIGESIEVEHPTTDENPNGTDENA